jgi:hypothetical protein
MVWHYWWYCLTLLMILFDMINDIVRHY